MFTDDAHIDYSSAGAAVGSRDEVVDWFAANFGVIPWSMPYITNIESDIDGDTAKVRTPDGWRSRHLREENVWFVNAPSG